MSCNISRDNNMTMRRDSMASLDTAYDSSNLMKDFQNKISNGNIHMNQNTGNNINDSIANLIDSNKLPYQSEEKIDMNVEKIVGEYYNRDHDIQKQLDRDIIGNQYTHPNVSTMQNGVEFPLNRSQYYSPEMHGSELLEGYSNVGSCMDPWRLILLIILIAALIYGLYWLYTNNKTNNFDF